MWYATFTIYYAGFVRCLPIAHCVFFFNDTATTEIYTLSLHDALPISPGARARRERPLRGQGVRGPAGLLRLRRRSEEHTSELQSQSNLVCRLLLEKKQARLVQLNRAHPNCLTPTQIDDSIGHYHGETL